MPTTPPDSSSLDQLERDLHQMHRTIRLTIQKHLASYSGQSLGNLADNQLLARSIHQMLERYGLRVRCAECGNPSILRVSPRKGSTGGVFVFDHTLDGKRTFHGGRNVCPDIRLVAKPDRERQPREKSN